MINKLSENWFDICSNLIALLMVVVHDGGMVATARLMHVMNAFSVNACDE